MTTATVRKTSLKNKHLLTCDSFAIIPSCSHSTILLKYAKTLLYARRWNKDSFMFKLSSYCKCENFTLLFCRGRHVIFLKCVPYVQHAYFSSLNQSSSWFAAYLMLLTLSILKLPHGLQQAFRWVSFYFVSHSILCMHAKALFGSSLKMLLKCPPSYSICCVIFVWLAWRSDNC